MSKTKIEYSDENFNPVWGCPRIKTCTFKCYAEGQAKRYAPNLKNYVTSEEMERLKRFELVYLPYKFDRVSFHKDTKIVFVGTMSDICYWEDEWMHRTIDVVNKYPTKHFLFLTKTPMYEKFDFPKNSWLGVTIHDEKQLHQVVKTFGHDKLGKKNKLFISFEPLMFDTRKAEVQEDLNKILDNVDWVLIGTMSGSGRVASKLEWIEDLTKKSKTKGKAVFVKQIDIKGKVVKDMNKFPESIQFREYPF